MSLSALVWAFQQEIKPASAKFVLVAFADCVSDLDACGFPSIEKICEKTSLDRKTVISSLDRLEEMGVIEDTHKRVGRTGQVKVYKLVGMKTGMSNYVYRLTNEETGQFYIGVRSCWGNPYEDNYRGSGSWPLSLTTRESKALKKEIISVFDSREEAERIEKELISKHIDMTNCMNFMAPAKEYRSSDQRVPTSDENSTAFPGKESQKRDTESKGTVRGNQTEPEGAKRAVRFDPLMIELPECIPREVWGQWIAYRRQRRLSTTQQTAEAQVRKLAALAKDSQPPDKVIGQSIENGWQGLFELKRAGKPAPRENFQDKDYGQGVRPL